MQRFLHSVLAVSVVSFLLFVAGCGGDAPDKKDAPQKKEPVAITSFNILDGQVLKGNKPLIVSFSEPMVDAALVDTPLEGNTRPFSVVPPIAGEFRWLSPTTAAFIPSGEFPRGRRYKVHLKEGLASAAGNPAACSFAFKTEGVELEDVTPGVYDEEKHELLLHFRFSMSISAAGLREHLSITDTADGEALEPGFTDSATLSSRQDVVVRLGKPRESLTITLREDTHDDAELFGMNAPYKAVLRLPESGRDIARIEAAEEASPSTIDFSYVYDWENDQGQIRVEYRLRGAPAGREQNQFIRVEPDLPYILDGYGNISFRDAPPNTLLTVTLLPGLLDSTGKVLREERSKSYQIPDHRPGVRFSDKRGILTPADGGRIGISHTNIDKVSLTLYRQYDNNIPFMSIATDGTVTDMMHRLHYKEVLLEDTERNAVYRKAVDLDELAEGRRGVFLLSAAGYERRRDTHSGEYFAYVGSNDILVVLTDIGVTARVFPSGITVFANALSTAEPLENALVRVYSNSNQLIAEGRTGPEGLFVHKQPAAWDKQLLPGIITVETGREGDNPDITFLTLNDQHRIALENTGERAYLDEGHEAFVYTPRGVFRPGETVDIKAFVRDKAMSPPAPFPVLFTVTSSRGTETASGSAVLSPEGGADFFFQLPPSAPTGRYTARLGLPGQKGAVLGDCVFNVEDFVPPRLEVAVTPEADTLFGGNALPTSLSGQYLFGAPGNGLAFELGYRAVPRTFAHADWEGYTFGDAERSFTGESKLDYITGLLDENGLAAPAFTAPDEWKNAPALLQVQLIAGVREDGGRWVSNSAMLTYWPTPFLLGLKPDESLTPGTEGRIRAAAVAPDGAVVDAGPFLVEVFEVQGRWHTVHRDGRYTYIWDEVLIPKAKFEQAAENGVADFPFTPETYGRYLVKAATADKAVTASCRFSVWGEGGDAGDDGSGRMDTVELAFDKVAYLAGETAKLSVKAPYTGTLLLGLERGEQTDTRVLALDGPATVLDIPVTADMAPNITVTAWVVRPVQTENREWHSHRAYGTTSLVLSREPHTLQVSAVTPEKALPDTPLTVHFTVTDHHGVPVEGEFSAALIDEGILSLTAYATPDPTAYFTAKRKAVGDSYDAFDALLRPEAKAVPLLAAGGDALADYQGSLSTQQIFLTAYRATVKTDANGQGEVTFDVPEYSGKARLMIVGASGDRFASGASPVRVARDVTVETSAPRAVAPGDAYTVHLTLFAAPQDGQPVGEEARIRVSAAGPLAFTGATEFTLPLSDGGAASRTLEIPVKAADNAGIGRVTVHVDVPGRDDLSYAKTFETVVRPPYPRTGAAASAMLRAGESAVLELPGRRIPGTEKVLLTVDRSPVSAALPVLEYLREYPYGCLEQLTSRAWPYLRLAEIQKALSPEKDAAPNARAALRDIARSLLAMQTPSGGFGAWPGYAEADPWRSAHATLFLVEAGSQIAVPRAALENALGYLRLLSSLPETSFDNDPGYAAAVKAYAAFVLARAGQAQPAALQYLSAREEIMPPSGRIFLAGAKALQAGNPKALEALDAAALTPDTPNVFNRTFESELRNRSLLLYMWALAAPMDQRTGRLAADLAERLLAAGRFSTQEAGFAALALGAWLEHTPVTGDDPFTVEVTADGKNVASAANRRLVLDGDALPLRGDGAPQSVTVSTDGKGMLFAVYNVRGIPMDPPAPVSSGIRIQRLWTNAAGEAVDLSSGTVRLKKGDRITVELVLQTDQPVTDIAVSDLLPGGMEVENPRLAASAAYDASEEEEEDGAPVSLYMDLREDRLLVFFDAVNGTARYTYTMRAVSKGSFALPPAAADAMYVPAVHAVTPAGTLVVE